MKRRGLHTIIGAVFFVLVMGSTIGYVTYSMDLIDNLANQVDVKQDLNLNRQSEQLKVSNVRIDNNEFNLTVTNTGSLPINITSMWAKNMTDPLFNQTKYQVNKLVFPGQSVYNIGQGTGLVAMNSSSYLLKLVTERGNVASTQLLSAISQPLDMKLYVTPSSPVSTSNVTLLYAVKNNLTEGKIIQSLTPKLATPTVTGSATATWKQGPIPASVDSLPPGEMALFEWTYFVEGNDGDKINYNATIANAVQGNFATDSTEILVPPISNSAINEVLGGSVGIISMDFDSFQVCKPSTQICTSLSIEWQRAWLMDVSSNYIWRMNLTNNGIEDILLDKYSALLVLKAQSGGGGNIAKAFFIKNDSTQLVEDGGAYSPNYNKWLLANATTTVYFGANGAGGSGLETTHGDVSIYAVDLLIFGYDDTDDDRQVTPVIDPPYSQNLPFQAVRMQ